MRVFLVTIHLAEYVYRLAALGEHHQVLLVVEEGNFLFFNSFEFHVSLGVLGADKRLACSKISQDLGDLF